MAKADKKNQQAEAGESKKVITESPSSTKKIVEEPVTEPELTESTSETESTEEESKTLPKIRLKVEEEAGKVKQFATAQGLSMHLKVTKAKRTGLEALHKVATWLTPKKKK